MLLFWLRCKIKFRLVKQCSTGGMFSQTGGWRPRNPPQVLKPPPCHHPPKCPHEASPTHHQVHQPNHNQPTTTNLPAHYKPINPVISQVLDWRSQESMKWISQPTFSSQAGTLSRNELETKYQWLKVWLSQVRSVRKPVKIVVGNLLEHLTVLTCLLIVLGQ